MEKIFLSFSAVIFSIFLNAQIVHTDLEPDYWVESVTPATLIGAGSETRIDIDGDGVLDYYFRLDHADYDSWWWCHLDTDHNNEMASVYPLTGVSPFPIPFPDTLAFGTLIDDSHDWADISLDVNAVLGMRQNSISVNQPHITNLGDFYIPLRFDIGGNDHYAWMLLTATVNADSMTVIVKEYAYESTPNKPIILGDDGTMSSIDELTTSFEIYPNPIIDFLNLKYAAGLVYDQLFIHSLTGTLVYQTTVINQPTDLSFLKSGIYMVSLMNGNAIVQRQKFIKG